jgi:hypothetical protein
VTEARQRVQSLDRLRNLVQRTADKVSLQGEKGLATIAANLPQGYQHALKDRVTLAMRRVRAFAKLEKALKEDINDAAIVAAWQSVVKAQCEHFVSIEWGMRIAVAEERLPVFRALSKITSALAPDDRDKRILAVWKEKLMADCREADKWRPLYQMAAVRREVLKRLQASMEAGNDAEIVLWGGKRCLTNYPLPKDISEAVAAARERLGKAGSAATTAGDAVEHNTSAETVIASAENGNHAGDETAGEKNGEVPVPGDAIPDASPRWKWSRLFSRRGEAAETKENQPTEEGDVNP